MMHIIPRLPVHFGSLLISGFGPKQAPRQTLMGEIPNQDADAFVRWMRDVYPRKYGPLMCDVLEREQPKSPQGAVLIRFRTDAHFDAGKLEAELADAVEAAGLTTRTFAE